MRVVSIRVVVLRSRQEIAATFDELEAVLRRCMELSVDAIEHHGAV
ncbi:hypothetical protein [Mycobacterium heckeshornense]|uniref:Uncharacterized protein n=1 Tax=Mycobacterium heckeshornense TaxID=110505 RepID=A0A7R7GY44_9MYCO|nr:hypothetical protein MHEC_38540 [Mycobacterium heckeshornense]